MPGAVRNAGTQIEQRVVAALHARGLEPECNPRDVIGTPDIVFRTDRAAVFVHGCFWHGHSCHLFKVPATRTEFWLSKIGRNRQRDAAVNIELAEQGWRVLEVWECAIKGKTRLPIDELAASIDAWLMGDLDVASLEGLRAGERA